MVNLITPEEIKDHDLLKFHRELLSSFLNTKTNFKLSTKNMILHVYDNTITEDNIRTVYNRNIKLFTAALVTNKLDSITNYHKQGSNINNIEYVQL